MIFGKILFLGRSVKMKRWNHLAIRRCSITIRRSPWLERHSERPCIREGQNTFTYRDLDIESGIIAAQIQSVTGKARLMGSSVGILSQPSFAWLTYFFGIWRAGGCAVPLGNHNPHPELEYVLSDSEAVLLVGSASLAQDINVLGNNLGIPTLLTPDQLPDTIRKKKPAVSEEETGLEERALILYTSGTTGTPKGVVNVHKNLLAQVSSLCEAWEWVPEDHILHLLPLHHIHGVVNAVLCPISVGACITFQSFKPHKIWRQICEADKAPFSVFMGVPTIYSKLISAFKSMSPEAQADARCSCNQFRVMICGSAALPEPVLHSWEEITGHVLLERYGMTEIGMALGNPLHGIRKAGRVGYPFPGIEVKIRASDGVLLVTGDTVFKEYHRREESTRYAFTDDGWFITGDVVTMDDEGSFKIEGRLSVDIIKTSGFKVSALEIERILLDHPKIDEVVVVGVPGDPIRGEAIGALIVLVEGESLNLRELQRWARLLLAPYKTPSKLVVTDMIPRNAMGKVNKTLLVEYFL